VRDCASEPETSGASQPIAAFDFDGTLTTRDSFTAFLIWRAGPLKLAAAALRLIPTFFAYAGHHDRGRLKGAVIRACLGPITLEQLVREAEAFCGEKADSLLRPDALAAWEAHAAAGHLRVIVTASPEPLVAPFAARLHADALIGSRLMLDVQGRLAGRLDGPNCRGPEKVARLKARFGESLNLVAAYGDTDGDADLLAAAQTGYFRVFTGRP
jgi:phosphatidylglycerophosphatase C